MDSFTDSLTDMIHSDPGSHTTSQQTSRYPLVTTADRYKWSCNEACLEVPPFETQLEEDMKVIIPIYPLITFSYTRYM